MNYNVPDHFSYQFMLNLAKTPSKCADRISLKILFPGLIAALFLIMLGCYELLNGARPENDTLSPFWFNLTFFDSILILLGVWIICSLLLHYFRYKKVFFDGKKITMIYRSPFGSKTTVKESIKKYIGVRFRVEFFQFGFLNKNKYIIELYSDNLDKIAPLYISTKGHNIRKIWEEYARTLNLPQVITTDSGVAIRETKDLGKSLIQLHKEGSLKNEFDIKESIPTDITWVHKSDKEVIKNRKIHWDWYNILTLIGCVFCFLLFLAFLPDAFRHISMLLLDASLFILTCLFIIRLFTKDKLIVKPHKLVIVHKTFMFSRKKYDVLKEDIQAVDIAYSPVAERYFLAIIGGDKTLVFGRRLSPETLRWIRDFVVNEIIKK